MTSSPPPLSVRLAPRIRNALHERVEAEGSTVTEVVQRSIAHELGLADATVDEVTVSLAGGTVRLRVEGVRWFDLSDEAATWLRGVADHLRDLEALT